jgi:hypothetical protein
MARSLGNLPRELQLGIAEALVDTPNGHAAILEWSCTSSFYRSLLAPYVFETVSLHNDEECASTLLSIRRGPYNEHVKKLVYTGFAHCVSEKYGSHTIHSVYPSLVHFVLSELGQFRCLSTVEIRFPSNYYDGPCLDHLVSDETLLPMQSANDAEKLKDQRIAIAQSLMNQTYKSLSQNVNHRIAALEIEDLELIEVATFSDETFHKFLHSIRRFQISMKEGLDPDYKDFIQDCLLPSAKLGSYFFDHLRCVSEFVFKGVKTGPTEFTTLFDGNLGLSRHQMPLLKRVHLERIFITWDLAEFFIGKPTTLEHISLHQCSASVDVEDGLPDNDPTWAVLFRNISSTMPSKLQQFTVAPHSVAEVYEHEDIMPQDLETFASLPERRVFRYADPNWRHGGTVINAEETIRKFMQGEDQQAYEELMEIVDGNALRLSKT